MCLWSLQTQSVDDSRDNSQTSDTNTSVSGSAEWGLHADMVPQFKLQALGVNSEIPTWYSSVDVMLTSKCFHGAPSSLTTSSSWRRPSDSLHTLNSLSAAAGGHVTGTHSEMNTWLHRLGNFTWQETEPYMNVACRPRILDRCLWWGAGGGSATEHFHWQLFGRCLAEIGSDLEEKRYEVYLMPHYFFLKRCCLNWSNYHPLGLLWNALWLALIFHNSVSLSFTSLWAQSVIHRWGGVVLLCLLTRQLPVQLVHFDVLGVAPAAHPFLQTALRTWDMQPRARPCQNQHVAGLHFISLQ